MNSKKLYVVILIIAIIVCVALFLSGRPKTIQIKDVTSFSFRYTTGDMINSSVEYTLVCENGVYTATIKPDGVSADDRKSYVVDKVFADKLSHFLRGQRVGDWNGFDKSDKHIMDGDSFSLFIEMSGETLVSARGYMKWPKNYGAVKEGIEAMFEELATGCFSLP